MTVGRRLLIVGPSWVGDMVMAQSLYRLLTERDADARLDVLAPRWSLPLLARMPEVARAIELPVGHGQLGIADRWRVGRRLRAESYDQAIVLPRSLKAALVPWFAGVPVRTGYRGEWRHHLINDIRPFDPAVLDQTVKRFVALAGTAADPVPEPPRPHLTVDATNQQRLEARFALRRDRPVIALMPGAEYGEAKRWPVERFAELAGRLARTGASVWVLGSARERVLGDSIAAAVPDSLNLCGETTLADAIDLLAMAAVAVTNDSGLMHVAAAVDTHVVAIYGSSSPAFTPPLTRASTVVRIDLPCSPCWQRRCPLGHLQCLHGIPAMRVLEATENVLVRRVGGAG